MASAGEEPSRPLVDEAWSASEAQALPRLSARARALASCPAIALLACACAGVAAWRSPSTGAAVVQAAGVARLSEARNVVVDVDPGQRGCAGGVASVESDAAQLCAEPAALPLAWEEWPAALPSVPARQPQEDTRFLERLSERLDGLPGLDEALAALGRLELVNARDVVAFRETWTDEDTAALLQLQGGAGESDAKRIRERLPSVQDFADLVGGQPTAMLINAQKMKFSDLAVGSTVRDVVVCFNDFVGVRRIPGSSHTKMAVLEACGVLGSETPDTMRFEMDIASTMDVYCSMLDEGGHEESGQVVYMLRPTAACALQAEGVRFTPAFLFYWLIGRLFGQLDMFGFVEPDPDDPDTLLLFQHLVYTMVAEPPPPSPEPTPEPTPAPPPTQARVSAPTSQSWSLPWLSAPAPPTPVPPTPVPPTPVPVEEGDAEPAATATTETTGTSTTTPSPPGGRCATISGNAFEGSTKSSGLCPERADFGAARPPTRDRIAALDDDLLERLRRYVDTHEDDPRTEKFEEALEALERWKHVNAGDILALQETWTHEDTQILRSLDDSADGFADGELTTEGVRKKLPTAADFTYLVRDRPIAIVGAADGLQTSAFGPEIDQHPVVVRFNDHVKEHLRPETTGLRTTVHVSCDVAGPLRDPDVAEFDMETLKPWASYCSKMHRGGHLSFHGPNVTLGFMIRPMAICALGPEAAQFTRGFLFYWFVGRIFNEVDLYGFVGDGHYDSGAQVWEGYLEFEHLVYSFAVSGTGHGSDVNRRTTSQWTTSTTTTTTTPTTL